MATAAGADHGAVVDYRAGPIVGGMACITIIGTVDVFDALAGAACAVVAAGAGAVYRRVIDARHGAPGASGMAGVATVGGVDVRGVLAGGGTAVVAV